MTMRVDIERDMAAEDGYNQRGPTSWQTLSEDVPCYAWQGTGRPSAERSVEQVVRTDMPGMVVPLGTDIQAGDRIRRIADRRGRELFGAMPVDAVRRRRDHLRVDLREHV